MFEDHHIVVAFSFEPVNRWNPYACDALIDIIFMRELRVRCLDELKLDGNLLL